jgi:hypothetical protein
MIGVTLGGVTVGLLLLLRHLIDWFPGIKALKKKPIPYLGQLVPFVYGWAYGALGVLTVMGLIGWAFDAALWASNWVGDALLWLGVGESPGQSAQGPTVALTTFGNCTVVILTGVTLSLIKKTGYGPDVKAGVWCGTCLGTSSGVAGLAAVPLAQGINELGSLVYERFV